MQFYLTRTGIETNYLNYNQINRQIMELTSQAQKKSMPGSNSTESDLQRADQYGYPHRRDRGGGKNNSEEIR
jgi:hypothetical protein